MSYNQPASRRKSPCCIAIIIIGVIIIGLFAAVGIFSYRFVKERVEVIDVTQIPDPSATASREEVLPGAAGDFQRVTISDNLTSAMPEMADVHTTGVAFGLYKDSSNNEVTVIAVPTNASEVPDLGGFENIIKQRNNQKSNNAISIKDTFSGKEPKSIVTWAKPNWSYIVQSTSTLAAEFVKDLNSATGDTGTSPTQATE